jgi:hypothetical protein
MAEAPTAVPAKPAELTARVAVQPGETIRGIPSFIFSVPQGWVLDGFWVNAILSHDRIARGIDFEKAVKATWGRLKQTNPDATASFEKMARFGTNVVYLRGAELKAPKSGRDLAQLHALFFAPTSGEGKTVDFFQIVATAPADKMERFAIPFLEIIGSFRFT